MKKEIIEILMETLSYAYCDNCGTEDCDDCHRKYQSWSLGFNTAECIADKIIDIIT